MTFIDLCAACAPRHIETCLVGIVDGHCARCGKPGSSPDLARFRVELPPERQAFVNLLRIRRAKLMLRRMVGQSPVLGLATLGLLALSSLPPHPKDRPS